VLELVVVLVPVLVLVLVLVLAVVVALPPVLTGVPGVFGSSFGRGGSDGTSTLQPITATTVGADATPRTTRIRPTSRMAEL
jgi:hypothetical protein